MILDDIRAALEGVDDVVLYGTASTLPKDAPWNYTVFGRRKTRVNDNLASTAQEFDVAVVREGYVPEGLEDAVVAAMRTIPGMNPVKGQSVQYMYDRKPGTNLVVEMMVITFARPRKPEGWR